MSSASSACWSGGKANVFGDASHPVTREMKRAASLVSEGRRTLELHAYDARVKGEKVARADHVRESVMEHVSQCEAFWQRHGASFHGGEHDEPNLSRGDVRKFLSALGEAHNVVKRASTYRAKPFEALQSYAPPKLLGVKRQKTSGKEEDIGAAAAAAAAAADDDDVEAKFRSAMLEFGTAEYAGAAYVFTNDDVTRSANEASNAFPESAQKDFAKYVVDLGCAWTEFNRAAAADFLQRRDDKTPPWWTHHPFTFEGPGFSLLQTLRQVARHMSWQRDDVPYTAKASIYISALYKKIGRLMTSEGEEGYAPLLLLLESFIKRLREDAARLNRAGAGGNENGEDNDDGAGGWGFDGDAGEGDVSEEDATRQHIKLHATYSRLNDRVKAAEAAASKVLSHALELTQTREAFMERDDRSDFLLLRDLYAAVSASAEDVKAAATAYWRELKEDVRAALSKALTRKSLYSFWLPAALLSVVAFIGISLILGSSVVIMDIMLNINTAQRSWRLAEDTAGFVGSHVAVGVKTAVGAATGAGVPLPTQKTYTDAAVSFVTGEAKSLVAHVGNAFDGVLAATETGAQVYMQRSEEEIVQDIPFSVVLAIKEALGGSFDAVIKGTSPGWREENEYVEAAAKTLRLQGIDLASMMPAGSSVAAGGASLFKETTLRSPLFMRTFTAKVFGEEAVRTGSYVNVLALRKLLYRLRPEQAKDATAAAVAAVAMTPAAAAAAATAETAGPQTCPLEAISFSSPWVSTAAAAAAAAPPQADTGQDNGWSSAILISVAACALGGLAGGYVWLNTEETSQLSWYRRMRRVVAAGSVALLVAVSAFTLMNTLNVLRVVANGYDVALLLANFTHTVRTQPTHIIMKALRGAAISTLTPANLILTGLFLAFPWMHYIAASILFARVLFAIVTSETVKETVSDAVGAVSRAVRGAPAAGPVSSLWVRSERRYADSVSEIASHERDAAAYFKKLEARFEVVDAKGKGGGGSKRFRTESERLRALNKALAAAEANLRRAAAMTTESSLRARHRRRIALGWVDVSESVNKKTSPPSSGAKSIVSGFVDMISGYFQGFHAKEHADELAKAAAAAITATKTGTSSSSPRATRDPAIKKRPSGARKAKK